MPLAEREMGKKETSTLNELEGNEKGGKRKRILLEGRREELGI